jgi:hypothetical protein
VILWGTTWLETFNDRELNAEADKSQLEVAPIDGVTTAKDVRQFV